MNNLTLISIMIFTVLSGCSALIPEASPKKTFILAHKSDLPCVDSSSADLWATGATFKVEEKETASIYRTNKIWFQNNAELGSYQFAEWAESSTDRLGRLIKETLRCHEIKLQGNKSLGKLEFSILRFLHELPATEGNNGNLLLSIRVSLTLLDGRKSEKTYTYSESLKTYDVNGAVESSSAVTEQFLSDLKLDIASFD